MSVGIGATGKLSHCSGWRAEGSNLWCESGRLQAGSGLGEASEVRLCETLLSTTSLHSGQSMILSIECVTWRGKAVQTKPLPIAALLYLCVSTSVFACNCAVAATPCEFDAGHHGQTAFLGVAVSAATVSDVVEFGGRARHATVQKVTFRVEEAFENTPGKLVDVYGWGTTCDLRFTLGTRYLVYGFRGNDGKIRTDRCTRTAKASDAAEDLRFLRGLPSSRAHCSGQ